MIELNLAHDPMRKDFLSRMKTKIQLKVLVLVTYQNHTCILDQEIFALEYIEAQHVFFKTSSDDMLAYGNQQRCLNFTGIDCYCSHFFAFKNVKIDYMFQLSEALQVHSVPITETLNIIYPKKIMEVFKKNNL